MRLEDLGFNPRTGFHDKRLTRLESAFVGALWIEHVGHENRVSAFDLACKVCVSVTGAEPTMTPVLEEWKRTVRRLQNHILTMHENIPVLSRPGNAGGYWIAANDEEARDFYSSFRKRGLTAVSYTHLTLPTN